MPSIHRVRAFCGNMRPRFVISLLVLLILVLAIAFWLRPKHSAAVAPPAQETVQPANQTASNGNSASQSVSPTPPPIQQANQQTIVTHKTETPEQARQEIESANAPIEFYGKVIDQDSNPVPDAKVDIGIRHWTMPDPAIQLAGSDTIHLDQTSDANGRFEFHGATGDGFGVGITKDGYELKPNRYGFGPTAGSYENPVIVKMWKLGEKAQLVSGSKFWGINPDGRVYTIDFLQQKKTEGENAQGDIKISIVRPTQIQPRTKFDWSFSIEAVNGGLIETDDGFMYLAPESGYQPSYQITMIATNADWKGELDGLQFYLKSRDGQVYGRFTFDLIPNYKDVSVFNVNWAVNPNGSRNLQP